jgi:maltose O-acetyltransferase
MLTEKQKMLAGEVYYANDPELCQDRLQAKALCQALNLLPPDQTTHQTELIAKLLGYPTDAAITTPFFCDYGYNIRLGKNVYFNFNCIILDGALVTIGDRSLFGPNVQIYTALHPLNVAERSSGLESAKPIVVGEDVWVGGSAIICPGVTIGSGAVIGAGSVVTRDIPSLTLAVGNPCRVIRSLE